MPTQTERHRELLRLVEHYDVASQTHLLKLLRRRGIATTQATLSRDMTRLGLSKVRTPGGGLRYVPAGNPTTAAHVPLATRLVYSVESSGNLLVIKTGAGDAPAVALAIDRMRLPEVLGTVAGDDTLLAVLKRGSGGRRVRNLLTKWKAQ